MAKNLTMQVGTWDKPPHYCVVGSSVDFYVYDSTRGTRAWSGWVKGREAMAYWSKFLGLVKRKDDAGFIALVQEIFEKYPHKGY